MCLGYQSPCVSLSSSYFHRFQEKGYDLSEIYYFFREHLGLGFTGGKNLGASTLFGCERGGGMTGKWRHGRGEKSKPMKGTFLSYLLIPAGIQSWWAVLGDSVEHA